MSPLPLAAPHAAKGIYTWLNCNGFAKIKG